jgi:hypothetical protein
LFLNSHQKKIRIQNKKRGQKRRNSFVLFKRKMTGTRFETFREQRHLSHHSPSSPGSTGGMEFDEDMQNLPFTKKLFDMLSDTDNKQVITWNPGKLSLSLSVSLSLIGFFNHLSFFCSLLDGVSFEVLDPKGLERDVLPKYFRHSRFQSLVRQLNFYNFKVRSLSISLSLVLCVTLSLSLSLAESWQGTFFVDLLPRLLPTRSPRPIGLFEAQDEHLGVPGDGE